MKSSYKFNIRIDVFPRFVKEKVNHMERDIKNFIKYGYTQETADSLNTRIATFEDMQTDEELEGDIMISTENKNKLTQSTLDQIREIMLSVQSKYGKRSAMYKKFGASALSRVSDEKLLRTARRVARLALLYLEELKEKGVSERQIDELQQTAKMFDDSMERQDDAIADREIGTLKRVDEANQIYDVVVKICDIGKGIWKSKNEAKYNDYVIYDTPSGNSDNDKDVDKDEDEDEDERKY